MKTHMVVAAVTHMIAGTKIAVDAPAVSMLPVGNGDVQSEGGIESIWIREKKAKEAAIAASEGSISRATIRLPAGRSLCHLSKNSILESSKQQPSSSCRVI